MKKKTLLTPLVLLLVVSLSLVATGCPPPPPPVPVPEVFELIWASCFHRYSSMVRVHWELLDEIERRSGGRIRIKRFPDALLGGPLDTLPLITAGAIDFAAIVPAYHPGAMPLAEVLNNLFGAMGRHHDEALRVVNHLMLHDEVIAPMIAEEARAHNIKVIHPLGSYPYVIFSSAEIRTLADLEGLKIRSFGVWLPRLLEPLGMVPVTVMFGEMYEALKHGVIDGVPMSFDIVEMLKWYEVAPWASFSIGSSMWVPLYMNIDSFERLPPDLQEMIATLSAEFGKEMDLALFAEINREAREAMEAAGVTFFEVCEVEQAKIYEVADGLWEIWVAEMIADEMGDEARAMYERWKKAIAEIRR